MSTSYASEVQLAANRANALKSTGPKTEEGKAASSRNARKHGFHCGVLILADESVEEFDQLAAELVASYRPRNRAERLIVDLISAAQWKLRRLRRYEQASIQCAYDLKVRDRGKRGPELVLDAQEFQNGQGGSYDQRNIEYLEDQLHNRIARAHRELERVRRLARIAPPETSAEEESGNEANSGPGDERAANPRNEAKSGVSDEGTGACAGDRPFESTVESSDMQAEACTPGGWGAGRGAPTPDLRL